MPDTKPSTTAGAAVPQPAATSSEAKPAGNWEDSVKAAAQNLASKLENAATLSVSTEYVEAAEPGGAQETVIKLQTVIHLDADSTNTVPVRRVPGAGLQVDLPLHQIHESNVKAAMEYRTRLLTTLLDAVKSQLR